MLINILLVISVILNILFIVYFSRSFKLLKSYEEILLEFRERLEESHGQLEEINHKEYFQEHDSVGMTFKTIYRISHDLNNFLEK